MKATLLIIALTLTLLPDNSSAQSKTSFGSDNATRCYRESNQPLSDHGLRYCDEAIRNDELMIRDLAATYTNRGIIYAANGKLEEAMSDHNQAVLLAPTMGKIFVNRGNVYHQTHNYDLALADYQTALELKNVAADIVHYNRALSLIQLKRWDDARASLEAALEHNPNSGRVKRKLEQFNAPREKPSSVVVSPEDQL